jgi:hypothetical protein
LRKKTAVACSAVEGTATSDWAKHRFAEQKSRMAMVISFASSLRGRTNWRESRRIALVCLPSDAQNGGFYRDIVAAELGVSQILWKRRNTKPLDDKYE